MRILSLVGAANCCLWTREQAESEYFIAAGTPLDPPQHCWLLPSFLLRVNLGKIGDERMERWLWLRHGSTSATSKHAAEKPGTPTGETHGNNLLQILTEAQWISIINKQQRNPDNGPRLWGLAEYSRWWPLQAAQCRDKAFSTAALEEGRQGQQPSTKAMTLWFH